MYPTVGLMYPHLETEEERIVACRALNEYHAEAFAPYRDRITPVAHRLCLAKRGRDAAGVEVVASDDDRSRHLSTRDEVVERNAEPGAGALFEMK